MYKVFLAPSAERDLKKHPGETFQRVVAALKALAEEPRPPGYRKLRGGKDAGRVRLGEHRILYEIDDGAQEVREFRVRRRKDVSRP